VGGLGVDVALGLVGRPLVRSGQGSGFRFQGSGFRVQGSGLGADVALGLVGRPLVRLRVLVCQTLQGRVWGLI